MEIESYLSYGHSEIPEVLKGCSRIVYMPKTERVNGWLLPAWSGGFRHKSFYIIVEC